MGQENVNIRFPIIVFPAIVPILESFYDPKTKLFHMVMETMEQNLYQLIKSRQNQAFEIRTIRSILSQILEALEHCHKNNYFHRDVKPENVLVTTLVTQHRKTPERLTTQKAKSPESEYITPPSTPEQYLVKLADFGLAREITSEPPYTSYVSTRWYRAPEIILRAGSYSAPVDLWAFGAMAAEVITLAPLFPGATEVDQIQRVCNIMGSPEDWRDRNYNSVGGGPWPDAAKLAERVSFSFKQTPPRTIESVIGPGWPQGMYRFITELLYWDPARRPTSSQALRHEFFEASPVTNSRNTSTSVSMDRQLEQSVLEQLDSASPVKSSDSSKPQESISVEPPSQASTDTSAVRRSLEAYSFTQPHRQSWFGRKKDSLLNMKNFELPEDVPAQNTRSKVRNMFNDLPRQPLAIDRTPISLLPPVHPISPIRDITPAIAKDKSTKKVAEKMGFLGHSGDQISKTGIAKSSSLSIGSPVLYRASPAVSPKKCIRSVSNMSIDSATTGKVGSVTQANEAKKPGLFSHLRKKHKVMEQENVSPLQSYSVIQKSPMTKKTSLRADAIPIPQQPLQKSNRQSVLAQSLPGQSTTSNIQLSYRHSVSGQAKARMSFLSPQTSGPISSRTRRAVEQSTKSRRATDGVYSTPVSRESQLLDIELQSAAQAMMHLDAFEELLEPTTKSAVKVPSYAKSTAASTRRSSAFHAASSGNVVPRLRRRLSSLPSSPSDDAQRRSSHVRQLC